jgi:phage FluMu protein Com
MVIVYCQGTKNKIGIPCRRYLGKVEGKAELLCPICKTLNVINNGVITVKDRQLK